jgi:tellurite methyltransferase
MPPDSTGTFNNVYQQSNFYYGLDVRPEFADFFASRDLTGLTALDMGCGEGRYALFLGRKGCQVTAVDRSKSGLKKLAQAAQTENLPISTRLSDIADFNFPQRTFDIVVAATVLDHLEDSLRTITTEGIRSSVKPGGIAYINVFTIDDPGFFGKTDASDTAEAMAYYFAHQELADLFADWTTHHYQETVELDESHGRPHDHAWACLIVEKPTS